MAPEEFAAWIDAACSELAEKADALIGDSGRWEMPVAGVGPKGERSFSIAHRLPSRQYEIREEFFRRLDESCPRQLVMELHRKYALTKLSKVRELLWMMQECREQLLSPERSGTRPNRRGRSKADSATIQYEKKLAADWKRAKESGEYKGNFAKRHNMNVKQFDALLDRVRKRKSRSDK